MLAWLFGVVVGTGIGHWWAYCRLARQVREANQVRADELLRQYQNCTVEELQFIIRTKEGRHAG